MGEGLVFGVVGQIDRYRVQGSRRPSSAGNGKTNLLTHILWQEFVQKDRKIIANYHLKYKGGSFFGSSWGTYMTSQEIFDKWFEPELEDAIIGITELQSLLNSAGRSSKVITYIEKCLNQRRKTGVEIVWDSQILSSVDLRIRVLTDEVYVPMKWHCVQDEKGNWHPTTDCSIPGCKQKHLIAVHMEIPEPEIIPRYFLKSWEIGELYDTKEKMRDTINYNPDWVET